MTTPLPPSEIVHKFIHFWESGPSLTVLSKILLWIVESCHVNVKWIFRFNPNFVKLELKDEGWICLNICLWWARLVIQGGYLSSGNLTGQTLSSFLLSFVFANCAVVTFSSANLAPPISSSSTGAAWKTWVKISCAWKHFQCFDTIWNCLNPMESIKWFLKQMTNCLLHLLNILLTSNCEHENSNDFKI